MQYLLFLLAHPTSIFLAAVPSFNKPSYKSEVTGTSSNKFILRPVFSDSMLVGETLQIG